MTTYTTEPKINLAPIDSLRLGELGAKGRANPGAIRTLKCRTVAEGKFRHLNYIRHLDAHVIDEPPQLLGDDTAPNPSEAALAALGSCISVGIHANAVSRGITIRSLELELEADINITSVWGTGDTNPKPVGFTATRVKVHLNADAPREVLENLVAYAVDWSPVAGTYRSPVPIKASLA